MRKAVSIARMNLSRLVRDRTGIFFVFVFPFLIILALGATFGSGFTPKLGVINGDGALARDLVARLEADDRLAVRTFTDEVALTSAVERGEVEAGLIVPADFDARVQAGDTIALAYLARPSGSGQNLQLTVAAAVDAQGVELTAARFAVSQGAIGTFDQALAAADAGAAVVPRVTVAERAAGSDDPVRGFDAGAAQELVLFVFVTSLSASSMLVESRRLGCSRRMLASPTSMATIITGESLGRFGIALLQGMLILVGTMVLFGVDWGNPATTVITVALLALTATGAAMLMGSFVRNAQQAGGLGVFFGLVLAALGGAMVPLEVFPPTMATIAHVTPHAWALDAMNASLARNAVPTEVWRQLAVLAAYGVGLLVVATLVFRRTLTRSA